MFYYVLSFLFFFLGVFFLPWRLLISFIVSNPIRSSDYFRNALSLRRREIEMGKEDGGGGVHSEESADGGVDIWSSSSADASSADHLVVMVHGLFGSTANWEFAAKQFVRMLPDKVIVHRSKCNMRGLTFDGVDVMGERLAEEVIEVVNRRSEVKKISFLAHSLGGLVARYAIGKLYRPPRSKAEEDPSDGACYDNSRGTIYGLEAMNFITIATPHLGSRGNGQVPCLFGVTVFEKAATYVIHWICGRTGKHLFLTDCDEGKPPLLLRMVDDYGELRFMSALQAFKRRVAYSNVGFDHIVGWRTSSIRRKSELPKWENSLYAKYPHVVYEEFSKEDNADKCADVSIDVGNCDMLEEKMVSSLKRLSWERLDVSFHTSIQRFDAHNVIQVKDDLLHSEGADIIRHLIDHFVT